MPRLPVVSGRELVAFMQSFGYAVKRQRGTHIRVELVNDHGVWPETVPDHKEVAKGTLRSVLRRMRLATGVPIEELIRRLGSQR